MALKKDIELQNGIIVSHHRIVGNSINWKDKYVNIEVGHYISTAARTLDKDPVFISQYAVYDDKFPLTNGGIVQEELYAYLKSLDMYKGAEDEIVE